MFSYNKYSAVLMVVVVTVLAQQVHKPFYFQNHKQRCNCEPNKQCSEDGTCTSDTCASPYVGNTCQHANVSVSQKNTTIPPVLLDGDDSTCLTTNNSVIQPVIYQIVQPIHFIWIYLYRSLTQQMTPNIELYMRNVKQKVSTYFMVIDEHSMLIKVKENVMYDQLFFFNLPEDLCSLEVSLGRNLAISSSPDISSIYENDNVTNETKHALRAVDGDDTPSYDGKTQCIHTKNNPNETHWWKTHLKYDARVNWIKIVNRIKEFSCRLWDFELTLSNSDGNEVHTYKDDSMWSYIHIYSFPIAVDYAIREVKLSNTYNGTYDYHWCYDHGLLNFCEVYIYGEFQCPDKMYGAQCERECPGCSRELCDPDWGCPRGCLKGWTGHWCSEILTPTIHHDGPVTELSGNDKALTCTPIGNGVNLGNNYATTFYKNGDEFLLGKSGNTLSLSSTTTSDSGSYSCSVEAFGFRSARSLPVDINFIDEPTLEIIINVPIYDLQMDMYCTTVADASVTLSYTFRRDSAVIMEAANLTDSLFSVLAKKISTVYGGSDPFTGNFTCEVTADGTTFVSNVFTFPKNYRSSIPDNKCFFKYGPLCEFFCSDECAGLGDCNQTTAECLQGCKPGFLPPNCTNRCYGGNFGLNCSKTCFYCTRNETTNHYYCDHITGKCLNGCGPGYLDKYCEKISIVHADDIIQPETVLKYALVVVGVLVLLFWKYRFLHVFASTISTDSSDHVVIVVKERTSTQPAVSEYIQDTPVDPDSSVDPVGKGNYVKFQSSVDPVTQCIKSSSVVARVARQKKISIFQKAPKQQDKKQSNPRVNSDRK